MKILHIINMLAPGGAELVSLMILKELKEKHGFECYVYGIRKNPSSKGRDLFDDKLGKDFVYEGEYGSMRSLAVFSATRGRLNSLINEINPDIVHSHCEAPDLFLASLRLNSNIIKLRTCHNERYWSRRYVGPAFENILARVFDCNVCISTKTLNNHHTKNKRLIYNGLRPVEDSSKEQEDTFTKTKVGIIGRISEQKNVLGLIDEIAKMDFELKEKASFHFYGMGPQLDEAKKRANGLSTEIVFHGFVDNIEAIYDDLGCVIIPSHYEGLSSVMIEALCRNTPVFSTQVSGAEDIDLILNYTLAYPTIRSILKSVLLPLPEISEQSLSRIKKTFSPAECAEQHYEAYREMIRKPSVY